MQANELSQEQGLIVSAFSLTGWKERDGHNAVELGDIEVMRLDKINHFLREWPAQRGFLIVFKGMNEAAQVFIIKASPPGKVKKRGVFRAYSAFNTVKFSP